jgi:hypothetical protein
MTDKVMMELAKMQTELRNLRQDNKRYSQMLIDRDDKLRVIDDKYKEKIQKLKEKKGKNVK